MSKLLLFFLLLISPFLFAKNFYVSSSNGNDSNNGLSPILAWKTITKVNASMSLILPGDSVLFKSNEIFSGTLSITCSGTITQKITFGTYNGVLPAILLQQLTGNWVPNTVANTWVLSLQTPFPPTINQMYINDSFQHVGRFPNTGSLIIDSTVNRTTYLDAELSTAPDCSGGEVLIEVAGWQRTAVEIASQSASAFQLSKNVYYGAGFDQKGKRYWLRKDFDTLDEQGEWYYNPVTGKLYIYSLFDPSLLKLQFSSLDKNITISSCNYIKLENLSITNSNNTGLEINTSSNIEIDKFSITKAASYGILASNSSSLKITNSNFDKIGVGAIKFTTSHFCSIINNSITNVGNLDNVEVVDSPSGIFLVTCNNAVVKENTIDGLGMIGLWFKGNNNLIQNNIIRNYCIFLNDGGGIYTAGTSTGNQIIGNICQYGRIGGQNFGIYLDDYSKGYTVDGNICTDSNDAGIHLHDATNNIIVNNIFAYSKFRQMLLQMYRTTTGSITNTIKNNIMVSNNGLSAGYWLATPYSPTDLGSLLDSNFYIDPFKINKILIDLKGAINKQYNLNIWKAFNIDINSKESPLLYPSGTSSDFLKLYINDTKIPLTFYPSKNEVFINHKGDTVCGLVTLQPFSGIVLMKVPNQKTGISIQNIVSGGVIFSYENPQLPCPNPITNFQWNFPTGTIFLNGTTANSANPQVILPNNCTNCPISLTTNNGTQYLNFQETKNAAGIYIGGE
ncbi:hypothetical protein EMA8858_02427 [Emticicia aquatica]|jgi:parallel beta-helix repeat protein|uniref:Right handed beta helix domain-containing protein n=1 Tax=Emticicia aquatica TaxID=1681835 RepID=A0ABN8EYI5_9BACT|nr:right-handed parallel beta-helix repeat-containing protein [Emticicia aquatica]CAH0996296.1 hypothetical protein EMA8858_02427 [Emticicia aquatica]